MAEITPEDLASPVDAKPQQPEYMAPDLPEDIQRDVYGLAIALELEDKEMRDSRLLDWRRNEDYWNGIQNGFYSALANGYISGYGTNLGVQIPSQGGDEEVDEYNSTVNIYRAHGESIIAALSTGLPHVRFFPKNADNPDDISTSKASSKISEMIQKQNKAQWLFLHALYLLYTSPFIAAHTYRHENEKYGSKKEPVMGTVPMYMKEQTCQKCGSQIGPMENSEQPFLPTMEVPEASMMEGMEDMPPPEMAEGMMQDPLMTAPQEQPQMPICPQCGPTAVSVEYYQEDVPSVIDYKEVPKARECIDVYGALNIKVSHTASNFEESPYLILEREVHYTYLRGLYPDHADKIDTYLSQEALHRRTYAPDAKGVCSYSECYIRPWAYNFYLKTNNPTFNVLKSQFPEGLKICFVHELVLAIEPCNVDDEWTLTKSPLNRYIHGPAVGDPAIPCQDMRNDLVYMTLDTVKHGVGDTFANPDVLDFTQYSKFKNQPGSVFPAKPKRGESLSDAFVSIKSATLSQEVKEFWAQVDQDAQFVLGDFPSVFGGAQQSGSRTLGEYIESQSRALQRLSTPWKMLSLWWASVMSKSVNSYIKHALDDEYFVKSQGDSYENIWIRSAELNGELGEVESDISEQFPVTWSQKNAMFMKFISENPIEPILATMFHPENTHQVAEILGMSDLHIPGMSDRQKQLREISQLLKGQPDQMAMMPSVMPDTDVDNHEVHMEAIKAWATSEAGMEAKTNNPMGYANVIFHLRQHQLLMQPVMGPEGTEEEGKGKENPDDNGGESAPPPSE